MSGPTSVEQIINLAFDRIGWPEYIGNIFEGTKQARVALDAYGQTRDEILRSFDWGFAEKIDVAVLTGNVAPFPWTVEYAYPADCLKLRNMFGAVYTADQNDPRPLLWTVGSIAAAKVIWSKTASATLVYTKQAINPTLWEPLFVDALVDALAKRMAPALGPDAVKMAGENEKESDAKAMGTIG